jgi:hypothetical protein
VRASLLHFNLRVNGSEAYFVDGAVGAPATHAAVHSTVYAISAGVADAGGAALAQQLTTFLGRHGVAPSSCMMGRWWVDGLYRLGLWAGEAADLALTILTSPSYPSWLDMIAQVGCAPLRCVALECAGVCVYGAGGEGEGVGLGWVVVKCTC